jgi:hypothetical protein
MESLFLRLSSVRYGTYTWSLEKAVVVEVQYVSMCERRRNESDVAKVVKCYSMLNEKRVGSEKITSRTGDITLPCKLPGSV